MFQTHYAPQRPSAPSTPLSAYGDFTQQCLRAPRETLSCLEMSSKMGNAYFEAFLGEHLGNAVPLHEITTAFSFPNFSSENCQQSIQISTLSLSPCARLWNFSNPTKRSAPTFLIVAPNSGTAAQQMSAAVEAFLPYGNVRLVEQVDPHYVPAEYKNGLDQSTASLIAAMMLFTPNCHMISFSQSGVPATVATAWMYQNAEYRSAAPQSLTVIGSPINPSLSPDFLNRMATSTYGDPKYVPVGRGYAGAGRLILPGTIPKLYFKDASKKLRPHMSPQALPAEHIHDTLQRVFREFWLAKQEYRFGRELVETSAITCSVLTFAGALDRICPEDQVHDLHRITPHANQRCALTLEGCDHYDLVGATALSHQIAPVVAGAIKLRTHALCPA